MTGSVGGNPSFKCETPGIASCLGVAIPCDDKADCDKGNVCCGTTGNNGRYTQVQCQASCDPNNNEYEFCDPNAQPDECAANGQTCSLASGVLTGYYRCQ